MSDDARRAVDELLVEAADGNALRAAAAPHPLEASPRTAAVLAGRLLAAAMAYKAELADGTTYKTRVEFLSRLLAREVEDCCQIAEADGLYEFVRQSLARSIELRNAAGRAAAACVA